MTTRVLAAMLVSLAAVSAAAQGPITLTDVTASSGIAFRHTDGSSGQRYIVETVTAGVVTFDYNGDGRIDLYFVNGAPLRGSSAPPASDALYRNDGHWRFTDVTREAGLTEKAFGLGAAAADYDNDGDQDLYLSNYGPNALMRNNGDGTFTDVTRQAGVGRGNKVGAGVAFLDLERDGDLDLYAANYVRFTYENHRVRVVDGFPQYAGPKEFPPEPDNLFRNNGDGTFTDVSAESGIAAVAGTGMGIVAADYDADGDTDLFVLNDVAANFLFQNDGQGRFTEVGLLAGLAYNLNGHELGSMGVDCGDYDGDGRLDFFQTAYSGELPVLYRNLGDGLFEDVTLRSGAGAGLLPHVNWGTGLVDFDHDGRRDIYAACGHLQDNIAEYDDSTAWAVRDVLLWNAGGGRFEDVSDRAGSGLRVVRSGRGAAFDDLDNDGDIDVVVLNSRDVPTILRNDTRHANHWLQLRLVGTRSNRDGVGATARVTAGDRTQVAEVHAGRGYQGHFGTRLHFGLGPHSRADRIEIRWPSGTVDLLEDRAGDRLLTIKEGEGEPASRRSVE